MRLAQFFVEGSKNLATYFVLGLLFPGRLGVPVAVPGLRSGLHSPFCLGFQVPPTALAVGIISQLTLPLPSPTALADHVSLVLPLLGSLFCPLSFWQARLLPPSYPTTCPTTPGQQLRGGNLALGEATSSLEGGRLPQERVYVAGSLLPYQAKP